MFIDEEPGFCQEHSQSFLSMFMRIDRRFMGKCFGQMQEVGIYPGQIPVLGLLAYKDGLSQREIAERLRIKPPTVNVTVQRLEKAGFLYREADEKDQRISRIYLTEKGKQAKENGMKKVKENEKILLSGLSDAELCLLRRMLEQITENIDKIPGSSGKNDTKKARQQK
nr:MarR family transcriptional regulator [uncultured Blautia sp.]